MLQIGNATLERLLASAVAKPAPAYIFVGPRHVGKRTAAQWFVRQLLDVPEDYIAWQTHPDLCVLAPEEGKMQISVEQVRDLRERMSLRPSRAPRVVCYVPHADRLNDAGTNALLKIVEEPPAGAVSIFVTEDLGKIPATLQSRAVILPFHRTTPRVRGSVDERGLGADFSRAFLRAPTAGARFALIEDLTKVCESEEDAVTAWKEALTRAMEALDEELVHAGSSAGVLGIALIAAHRMAGSALSPRLPLEACAARLVEASADEVFRDLQPQHVRSAFFALYSS